MRFKALHWILKTCQWCLTCNDDTLKLYYPHHVSWCVGAARLGFNASPPRARSFTLGSKPLMHCAEYCLTWLTQSLVKCMNGCTCLCCCPGRWWDGFYADFSTEKCLQFPFTSSDTQLPVFFFATARVNVSQQQNAMQTFFFFFLKKYRFWLWCCAAGSAFSGFKS